MPILQRSNHRAFLFLAAGLVALTARASAQCPPQVLVPSVAAQPQWFGAQVTADDGLAVLSAPQEDGVGAVYAFSRDAATVLWSGTQRIEPSLRVNDMRFGIVMAQSGTTLVVAAPGPTDTFGGAAFVYGFDDGTQRWVETQVIREPGVGFFGSMVHVDGDFLAITDAWSHPTRSFGRVYLYRRQAPGGPFESYGTVDSIERHLTNNRFANDAVFLADDRILLADSEGSIPGERDAGAIYELVRNPADGSWEPVDRIVSPDPSGADRFGFWIHWDGSQLLAVEPRDDANSNLEGSISVFTRDVGGGWTLVQKLGPETSGAPLFYFGSRWIVGDGRLWARVTDLGTSPPTAYLESWLRDDATGLWRRVGRLDDPLLSGGAGFGTAGAVTDGTLIVGDPWSNQAVSPQGRGFAYDLERCSEFGLQYWAPAPVTSLGEEPSLVGFGSPIASDEQLALRATSLPPSTAAIVLASTTTGNSTPPASAGPLCLGGAIGRMGPPSLTTGTGTLTRFIETTSIATPMGTTAIAAGDTWNFQVWFRYPQATGTTSGLTNALQTVWL